METQVVVVGGGPAGMWLAVELRIAGVDVVVLEEGAQISDEPRGATVHPRTLELFEMRGLADPLLAEGLRLPVITISSLEAPIPYQLLDTDHQYVLTIPQVRTTMLLEERARELGAEIRRGHRVVGVEQDEDRAIAVVVGPDGEYRIDGSYLAGCDGTRSVVRQSVGIDFTGSSMSVASWGADVKMDNPPDSPRISHWSRDGMMGGFALPDGYYRVMGIASEDVGNERPGELTLDEVRSKVKQMMGTDFGMRDPIRMSYVGNSSRQANRYREGRVLIAGDAAHQHMPTGGMGMNVSIQDAANLGWKLAATVNGWAPEGLLDTYHDERHPVGVDLLELTQAQTALTVAFSDDGEGLRGLMVKLMREIPALTALIAGQLSSLSVRYPAGVGDDALVGTRAPNLRFADTDERLYPLFASAKYVLLDFAGEAEPPSDNGHITTVSRRLDPSDPHPEWSMVTAALIRPDGHVAWASREGRAGALHDQMLQAIQRTHS